MDGCEPLSCSVESGPSSPLPISQRRDCLVRLSAGRDYTLLMLVLLSELAVYCYNKLIITIVRLILIALMIWALCCLKIRALMCRLTIVSWGLCPSLMKLKSGKLRWLICFNCVLVS